MANPSDVFTSETLKDPLHFEHFRHRCIVSKHISSGRQCLLQMILFSGQVNEVDSADCMVGTSINLHHYSCLSSQASS